MSTCGYVRYATRPSQRATIARVTFACRSRLATTGTRRRRLAHAREELAFAVVEMLGHHRAVEVEVDAVERAVRLEPAHDLARDPLVRVARHVRRGARRRPGEADAPVAERAELADRAGGRNVGAVDRRRDRVAERHARPAAALLERLVVGLARGERVGFVLEAADGDAGHWFASVRGVRRAKGSGEPNGIHRRGQRMHRSGACLWPPWASAIVPASTLRELRHDAARSPARAHPPRRRRPRSGPERSEGAAHRAALEPQHPRPDLDDAVHGPQPRVHDLRHAVRHRREEPGEAADGGHLDGEPGQPAVDLHPARRAWSSTTASR